MKFCFYVNPFRPEAAKIAEELKSVITEYGCAIDQSADIVIAIGGDGTVVEAYRQTHLPIFAVNAGTLGYLPRIEPQNAKDALKNVIAGRYSMEERMTLNCSGSFGNINALNEAALVKKDTGVIRFSVEVDGMELMRYTADGIIAATPTGSTGYSLSCGGPILDPTSRILVLTPIAPHTLVNRSIVLSPTSTVCIRSQNDALVSIDGSAEAVSAGDTVSISVSESVMRFITLKSESFVARLREKLV